MENLMKFINISVPCWVLIIYTIFGILCCKTFKSIPESRRVKNLCKFRKKMIERVVKRVLDEMNDECKLYSKAFDIFWGAESKVRVFIYAKTKYKKDTAYVKFYVGADENTIAQWAPKYVYEITPLAGAEYWKEEDRDSLVDDMKQEYYKLLRRYL